MKFSNKLVIISGALCVFAVAVVAAALFRAQVSPKENKSSIISREKEDYGTVQNNVSAPIEKKKEQYIIRLEDGDICAYVAGGEGVLTLWNRVKAPLSLPDDERASLIDGIIVDSFEKLCLYFEAYSS